ncbi:DUF503 domain-containing protein [bacterium]|nr:DUF503 domain-containing protein [candidate division CSSED10-310 bacterium]
MVLHIPGVQSLKGKRHVVRSLKDRLRGKFNIAVAEVGSQNLWQKCELGVASVGADGKYLNGLLDQVVNFVREFGGAELLHYEINLE